MNCPRCMPPALHRSFSGALSSLCLALGLSCTGAGSGTPAEPASAAEPEPAAGVDAGPAQREPQTLTTADGLSIEAFLLDAGEGAPGVLLLHQFQRSMDQWGDFPEALHAQGYSVVAISYRGHGNSDAYSRALSELLTDPQGAPLDVDAGLAALLAAGADANRIAIVGTSIGANLAVASAIADDAKTYVSLSSRIPPAEALAQAEAQGMQSVFYISSENDAGGQAADATTLHERTAAPKELLIVDGGAHGIAILEGVPDVRTRILAWLATTLDG